MTSPELLSDEHTPPPSVSRPLRADAERNRQRLLAAAEEVFTERGLDATLDDIAAHAGVGVGTAYRRFANKEEVVKALFEIRMDAMIEHARACEAMPDAGEGLIRFLEETCSSMARDRGFRDILMRGGGGPSKLASIRDRLLPITERLVRRARESGAIRPEFQSLDLAMVILMIEAVSDATDRLDPDLWKRYLSLLLGGVRGGGAPAEPLPGRPLDPDQTEQAMSNRHTRR